MIFLDELTDKSGYLMKLNNMIPGILQCCEKFEPSLKSLVNFPKKRIPKKEKQSSSRVPENDYWLFCWMFSQKNDTENGFNLINLSW